MELPLELLLTVALSFLMAFFFKKIAPVSIPEDKDPDAQFQSHKSEREVDVIGESFECNRTRLEEKGIEETIAENSDIRNPNSSPAEEENSAIEAPYDSSQEDDDWEGIERSEIEKLFAEAVEYVGNQTFSELSDDQKMQLLGLHKIATEGPCNESQPMAFKASFRAKWYAWQKLGRMSPEEAMEKYVALLSDSIPRWKMQGRGGEEIRDPELRT